MNKGKLCKNRGKIVCKAKIAKEKTRAKKRKQEQKKVRKAYFKNLGNFA